MGYNSYQKLVDVDLRGLIDHESYDWNQMEHAIFLECGVGQHTQSRKYNLALPENMSQTVEVAWKLVSAEQHILNSFIYVLMPESVFEYEQNQSV